MHECFELAKNGLGRTSPNPACGAIVLDKNGTPVGKGYHKSAGGDHAEVLAIKEADKKTQGGTLVVNLEPCCHTGKTPPCTDLIIKSQIKEVIFSTYDPNPQVYQKGEKILLENQVKVISRVLESEGFELNKFFFKWIKTKLPWVTLKQAQTFDGKVALKDTSNTCISSESSRIEVHKLRNTYDAILVGANTVNLDNPNLTVRDLKDTDARNPIRVILDPRLTTNPLSNVYKNNSKVILVTVLGHPKEKLMSYIEKSSNSKIEIIELPKYQNDRIDLKNLFYELGKINILSILIEAGPTLGTELVVNNLIDEYILFISPKIFGEGGIPSFSCNTAGYSSISTNFRLFNYKAIGNDLMLSYKTKI